MKKKQFNNKNKQLILWADWQKGLSPACRPAI